MAYVQDVLSRSECAELSTHATRVVQNFRVTRIHIQSWTLHEDVEIHAAVGQQCRSRAIIRVTVTVCKNAGSRIVSTHVSLAILLTVLSYCGYV